MELKEGVAGQRQATREDPWAEETQARRSREEGKTGRGPGWKATKASMTAWTWPSTRRGGGNPGVFCCARPTAPAFPSPPCASRSPSPTDLGRSTRRRLCLPLARGGREYAQPSSDPFSPDEDRRRPAFPLSIFASSCWSRSCSRCHLKTPQAGGGRGRGEERGGEARKVRTALAQETSPALRPEISRPSHLTRKSLPGTCFLCGLPPRVRFLSSLS